jgi:hypothetical protein
MEKKEPVILPIKDVEIARDAKDSTGQPVLLRVFRDHEEGVPPMYFVDFVTLFDGKARRGLVPLPDVDAPRLAEAIMRLQTDYQQMVVEWRAGAADRTPAGRRVPPRVEVVIDLPKVVKL